MTTANTAATATIVSLLCGTSSKRGRELSRMLGHWLDTSATTVERDILCSAIVRSTDIVQRQATNACNREVSEQETARSERHEGRIAVLVAALGCDREGAALSVSCHGDPRGYAVKILVPAAVRGNYGNTWGLGGEFGVD